MANSLAIIFILLFSGALAGLIVVLVTRKTCNSDCLDWPSSMYGGDAVSKNGWSIVCGGATTTVDAKNKTATIGCNHTWYPPSTEIELTCHCPN